MLTDFIATVTGVENVYAYEHDFFLPSHLIMLHLNEGLSNANKMLTQDSGMANGSGPLMKGHRTLRINAAHLFKKKYKKLTKVAVII